MKLRKVSKRGIGPVSSIRGARPGSSSGARPLRTDAAANRARLLRAAAEAFSQRGLEVSLDEIAARAGVGPGTLHRHFPTKDELVAATIAGGVEELTRAATELKEADDPVEAFCGFFLYAVEHGAASHALAHRLGRSGVNVNAAIASPVRELRAAFAVLFRRAKRAGGIRADLNVAHLDALLAGAHAIHVHPAGGVRLLAHLCDALRSHRRR